MIDIITVMLFLFAFALSYWYLRLPTNLPPGPFNWPFIGFLPLSRSKNRLEFMEGLRQKYGDIFVLWQGSIPMVIIFGPKLIREALVDKADYLSERPTWMHLNKRINKSKGIVWNPNNWRSIRKFVLNNLRDFGAGPASLEGKIQLECECVIEEFRKLEGQPFDCQDLVISAVSNIICSIVFGKRFEYDDPTFRETIDIMNKAFKSGAIFSRLNYFPWLAFIAWHLDIRNTYTRFMTPLENFIQAQVDVHRENFDPDHLGDFIDLYLQAENSQDDDLQMTRDDLRRAILDLFNAGTETTGTTLRWLFVYMIRYPDIQKKCRKEILEVIGSERSPRMNDRSRLRYVEATLLETQRMANIAPWTLPHSCRQPVKIGEYIIPKDSMVLPMLHSSHMDPEVWGDPEHFRPERWITDGKVNAKHPAFMPFSLGRRQCPGEQIARMELFLFGATFLQQFEIQAAEETPSLEGQLGLTLTPLPFRMRAMTINS